MCLFSPHLHPTPAKPPYLPHLHPPPWFCPCFLYSSSCNPLSSLSPPQSPLSIVRLFLTSMSLVIFCFLFSAIYYYLMSIKLISISNVYTNIKGVHIISLQTSVPVRLSSNLSPPTLYMFVCICTLPSTSRSYSFWSGSNWNSSTYYQFSPQQDITSNLY